MKLDQRINDAYSQEVYKDISYIEEEWRNGYYNVKVSHHKLKNKTNTHMKRLSKANILKADIKDLKDFNQGGSARSMFSFGNSIQEEIKLRNPLAYAAYSLLSEQVLIDLNYNIKKVECEVITVSNLRAEVKLLRLLKQEFKVGKDYSIAHINTKIQAIYHKLDIRDAKTGNVRKAEATQLGEHGRYEIWPCKMKEDKSNGFKLIRAQFSLAIAA